LRLLLNDDAAAKRQPGEKAVWVRSADRVKMKRLEGSQLIDFMCRKLKQSRLSVPELAALCRRVFQTPCRWARDPDTDREGILIKTGMEAFTCHQCGYCCTTLDYHRDITTRDIARWEADNRHDILKWVGITRNDRGEPTYRIWIEPGTNRFADRCPFLIRGSSPRKWICSIHDAKPDICRGYPLSRKHALNTGCPGFDR
jgi:Fe-S-cluster containining protein